MRADEQLITPRPLRSLATLRAQTRTQMFWEHPRRRRVRALSAAMSQQRQWHVCDSDSDLRLRLAIADAHPEAECPKQSLKAEALLPLPPNRLDS